MNTRSRKAIRNASCQLLLEFVTVICGLILPRLILSRFGSAYNGITQSISQFISCVAILKSGIGSVTRAALYEPLEKRDFQGISGVINTTEKFMRRIAMIFGMAVLMFACLYPFLVSEDFSWFFSFTLTLILSITTIAQYCFGMTYQMLIEADQNNYIISLVAVISTIANTIIASFLILRGCSIHEVKLGSAIVFIVPPIFFMFYARKKYHIDRNIPTDTSLLKQRWHAFGHQLANFINNNTDIMIATIFLDIKEVSVYAVYNMVAHNMAKIVNSFSTGTNAAFGNMLARKEFDNLKNRFNQYETLMYVICSILFTTTVILYIPFIKLYTKGITDVNYSRKMLAILFCAGGFFSCIKLVYENIIFAAGAFRDTKKMAYIEAIINIVISLILVNYIGLNGILIGTIVAGIFRTLIYNSYASRKILHRKSFCVVLKITYSTVCAIISYLILQCIIPWNSIEGYVIWAEYAMIVFGFVSMLCIITSFVVFYSDMNELLSIFRKLIKATK